LQQPLPGQALHQLRHRRRVGALQVRVRPGHHLRDVGLAQHSTELVAEPVDGVDDPAVVVSRDEDG